MAEILSADANKGEDMTVVTETIEEFIIGKDKVDLPQDYLFSPTATAAAAAVVDQVDSPRETFSKSDSEETVVATNKRAWVSPNKNDDVPSTTESSPSSDEMKFEAKDSNVSDVIKKLLDGFVKRKEEACIKTNADEENSDPDFDAEYATGFEVANEESEVNLTVIGKRLEIENFADVAAEAVLHASSKSFANIIHEEKRVMLVLPSRETSELGSTLELSETLAKSLGITDEIVGLKTTARVIDDESSAFKFHGECVMPFSALASGQLTRMIKNTDDGVPSFNLVTSNIESYLGNDIVPSVESESEVDDKETYGEESSSGTTREGVLHTETFVQLMENSDEFDPFEKNALLRFGIDNAEQGNILYRASFRVAVFMGDMSYFVRGLKKIAEILLSADAAPANNDNNESPRMASMTIFGLTDFVISADELFESDDVTPLQYATLLDAIFSEHSSIKALFDLYHNPDFLLACDSDEDIAGSLCMRDLVHLAKKLEPLQPQSSASDDLLKWAIKTGIHNFSATMSADTEVPQEFVNIIYHMFSSGDEMVLSACQNFVKSNDCDGVVDMLFREWDIYCGNKSFLSDDANSYQGPIQVLPEVESSLIKTFDSTATDGNFPSCLLTGVGCLVDQQEMSEDAAVKILVSYAEGDKLLHDIYDHFIEFGGVDDFLKMLKLVASNDSDGFVTSRSEATTLAPDNKTENAFRSALEEMKRDGLFNPVDIAALRLASARKDTELTRALADYRNNYMDLETFKQSILNVAERVIQGAETDMVADGILVRTGDSNNTGL